MAVCGHVRGPRPSRSQVQDRELWHTNALPSPGRFSESLSPADSSAQPRQEPGRKGLPQSPAQGGSCTLIQVSVYRTLAAEVTEAATAPGGAPGPGVCPGSSGQPCSQVWKKCGKGILLFRQLGGWGGRLSKVNRVNRASEQGPKVAEGPASGLRPVTPTGAPRAMGGQEPEAGPASLGPQGLRELQGSGRQPRRKVRGGGAWPVRGRRRRRRCSACPWWWGAPRGSA